jgi:hypothetical protein
VGRSTPLQRVGGACRRTFVLVAQLLFSQVPKFSFSTFGPPRLLPKLIRSRVDFLFTGFSHDVFSELEHDPPFRRVGDLPAETCQTSLETGLSDSSPHQAVGSSQGLPCETAAPKDKGQAGVTPHGLCRDCPAPRVDSVSGNRTANRQKRSRRRSLAENGFRGVDDAHGRILPAIGAELLGVLDEHVGVDDGLELICLAHKRNFRQRPRQINTAGKSLLIFRNRVKRRNQKYSA